MSEENMSDEDSSSPSALKIFAIGALAGAGLALLYAPRSGKETRKGLVKKAKLLRGKAQDTVETAREFIKDRSAEVAAVFEFGKEAVEEVKKKAS